MSILSHLRNGRQLLLMLDQTISRITVLPLRCLPTLALTALPCYNSFYRESPRYILSDTGASSSVQWLSTRSSSAQLSLFIFTLLQDESTAEITFYMKGADVAMSTIVQYNDWLEEEVSTLFSALYKMSS